MNIPEQDPKAIELVSAIKSGNVETIQRLLDETPGLARARIVDSRGSQRSLIHIATDWPGHFPNVRAVITTLVQAGADPNAAMIGPHAETPLHWAASSDDVEALDALLDNGADMELPGAIFTDGTPMSDAVVFGQWKAARRLLQRGAKTTFWQASALGILDQVKSSFESGTVPAPDEVTKSFWHACHGGQQNTAEFLLTRGADINWIGWDHLTPLGAATRSGNAELLTWLRSRGARLREELR
jgi:ankyrin repeat protein